jgi:hypothetical protein
MHHFRLIYRDADQLIGVVITVRQNRNASSAEAVTDYPVTERYPSQPQRRTNFH